MAELADALDLGSSSSRSAGSIPVIPTYFFKGFRTHRRLPFLNSPNAPGQIRGNVAFALILYRWLFQILGGTMSVVVDQEQKFNGMARKRPLKNLLCRRQDENLALRAVRSKTRER